MHNLHQLVEHSLEAPALAWNKLAFYWGMSAFGLGPAYIDYMQSDAAEIDRAFNDPANDDLNQIAGLDRRLTIKERFDRAANFYSYCYQQGMRTSINPPFDSPPDIETLMLSRLRMETKTPASDLFIQANTDSLLADRPDLLSLWKIGGQRQRKRRAENYNTRVLEHLNHIASELQSLVQVTGDQLSDTGFLLENLHGVQFNVTAGLMDNTMPQEVQQRKFGECYVQRTLDEEPTLVCSGIFGAYYTMGHNLELAMFDQESKSRLSSIHHAILHTWRQLDEISKENK
jgi:hypothetical protein